MFWILIGCLFITIYWLKVEISRNKTVNFQTEKRGFRQFSGSKQNYLFPISHLRNSQGGNKAQNLKFLQRSGFLIPETYVCDFSAYKKYKAGDENILTEIKSELRNVIIEDHLYSVRSSANVEDSRNSSFAGQFVSFLDVQGIDELLLAIQKVWDSGSSLGAQTYRGNIGKSSSSLEMAVIIQEMIPPQMSGVLFSKNPLTGLDETIVEAVEGYGSALVQDGITPLRWIYKWGEWKQKAETSPRIQSEVEQLIKTSQQIVRNYGAPLDLEWVFDGDRIYWLQAREISTLGHTILYSNRISKEFLPGIIKPLVWSINIPVVNHSWKRLFQELLGRTADRIKIENLAKAFYYRAYFNMGVIGDLFEIMGLPRESIEVMAGVQSLGPEKPTFKPSSRSFRFLPRISLVALKKLFFKKAIEVFLRDHPKAISGLSHPNWDKLTIEETFQNIDLLIKLNQKASYMVILTQLLNGIYNIGLKRQLKKDDIDFSSLNFPISKRMRMIDPRFQIRRLQIIYNKPSAAPEPIQSMLELSQNQTDEFQTQFKIFLQRFGHLSDSGNDFSKSTWRENPEILNQMLNNDVMTPELDKESKLSDSSTLKKVEKSYWYRKASEYKEYRELVTSLYTFSYSLFRLYFLHLGDKLKENGLLDLPSDIFYLSYTELKNLYQKKNPEASYKDRIEKRKSEIQQYADLQLPELIFDEAPPALVMRKQKRPVLTGVGTSKGYYTGKLRVIKGMDDFPKVQQGDVIVIPYSDVSWTPLFSKAKAIISESGGLLSHCSIVAREYEIPAVVSVPEAMSLENGTKVLVDGYHGQIIFLD